MTPQEKIRPGYKQTEMGLIPEDWHAVRVDQIGVVKGGKRLPLGRSLTERQTPYPYIRVSDMKNGTVEVDTVLFVPEDVAPIIRNYRISANDIYMSVAGTLGLVGVVPKGLDGANLTENADRITELKCNRDFLYFCLSSERIQSETHAKRTVGAQPKLAIQQIEAFQIPLPPTINEQRAIAEALSDADAWIAGLEAVIAKKRDLKQAAMQQLLTGKTRLPGFGPAVTKYKQTEVGVIPEDWNVERLGRLIAPPQAGVSVRSVPGEASGNGHKEMVLKTSCISKGRFFENEAKAILPADRSRARTPVRRDSILISRMNTPDLVGEVGYLEADYPDLYLPDRLWLARPAAQSEVSMKWLSALLAHGEAGQAVRETATGTSGSMKNISKRALLGVLLPCPAPNEQSAIAEVLSNMDADLAALEAEAAKARAIKQGMMQTLLTGQIRLA